MAQRTNRARARRAGPAPAGALVADVLARAGVAGAVREHRLVTEWEAIVGPRVASRAWPDGLKHGVLYVRVVSSAWLHELAFLREAIVAEANRVAGDPPIVREVRLHLEKLRTAPSPDDLVAELAAARRKRRPPPQPRAPLGAAASTRIDRETGGVADPELRAAIRAAWKKLEQGS